MQSRASAESLLEQADLLRPSAIRALATLRVADHLAAGVTDVAELAGRCGARVDMMDILLRYAASLQLVQRDEEQGTYRLTELGGFLRSDHPDSVGQHLSFEDVLGRADAAFVNLVQTIRTGQAAHHGLFGCGFWDSVNTQPEFAESLERRYQGTISFDAELIIDGYDWTGVGTVVDVGGHTGAVMATLLHRHPHLRGTLVDLKNSAEVAAKVFARAGLADRCDAVAGSFFDRLPPGGDVYLLSAILADWPDRDAVAILRRCGEAAGHTGRVLLAEVSMTPAPEHQQPPYLELYLRASMPAPARSVADLVELGHAAGLRLTWQGPATRVRSLLEFAAY